MVPCFNAPFAPPLKHTHPCQSSFCGLTPCFNGWEGCLIHVWGPILRTRGWFWPSRPCFGAFLRTRCPVGAGHDGKEGPAGRRARREGGPKVGGGGRAGRPGYFAEGRRFRMYFQSHCSRGPGRRATRGGSHTFMKEGLTTRRRRNMARSARRTSHAGV